MGGLYKRIPLVYVCFLIGSAALVALPWVSAGFYTKDDILWHAWASGNTGLFMAGLVGAIITALYTFRVFYLTFHGKEHGECHKIKGWNYALPIIVLAILSTFIGGLIYPPLAPIFPEITIAPFMAAHKHSIELLTIVCVLGALLLAAWWFTRKDRVEDMVGIPRTFGEKILANAFGFDILYEKTIVNPYLWVAKKLHNDPLAQVWLLLERFCGKLFSLNSRWQTGQVRHYAISFAGGLFLVVLIIIFVMKLGG